MRRRARAHRRSGLRSGSQSSQATRLAQSRGRGGVRACLEASCPGRGCRLRPRQVGSRRAAGGRSAFPGEPHAGAHVRADASVLVPTGGYSADHPVIRVFWRVVEGFTDEEKRKLLKFVTSCSRPPLLGFKVSGPRTARSRKGCAGDRTPAPPRRGQPGRRQVFLSLLALSVRRILMRGSPRAFLARVPG